MGVDREGANMQVPRSKQASGFGLELEFSLDLRLGSELG